MNIFQLTKNAHELTPEQLAVLFSHIEQYSNTSNGAWLNDIDYKSMTYKWSPAMENSDIMAAKPLLGKGVLCRPNGKNPDYWVSLIAPSVIHELRHTWQIKKHGILLYSICSVVSRIFLVFSEKLYSTTLMEKSAFECEDNARTMIGRI